MAAALRWITLVAVLSVPIAAQAAGREKPIKCDAGPVQKTFGATEWFVLSCSDQRTLIVYSMPDNPASPYYFMWEPKAGGRVQLRGSAIGDKTAMRSALKELKAMSPQDAAALVEETRRAARARKR